MKDIDERCGELERRNEALENAILEIKSATWEPRMTLPELRRRIAVALQKVNAFR